MKAFYDLPPSMRNFIRNKLNTDYAYQLLKIGKTPQDIIQELNDTRVTVEFSRNDFGVNGIYYDDSKNIFIIANEEVAKRKL